MIPACWVGFMVGGYKVERDERWLRAFPLQWNLVEEAKLLHRMCGAE
jgi:hypothetical protein